MEPLSSWEFSTLRVLLEDAPHDDDVQILRDGLHDHAAEHLVAPGFEPLGVFMRDATGRIVGGVWGYVNWNWLFVGLVTMAKLISDFQERIKVLGITHCVSFHCWCKIVLHSVVLAVIAPMMLIWSIFNREYDFVVIPPVDES